MSKGKYSKKPLSIDEQISKLLSQGLICEDNDYLKSKLQTVSYFRLKGYWYPYKEINPVNPPKYIFKKGTDFKYIWNLYRFDRKLRFLLFDAIDRVEIYTRTQIVNRHSLRHGEFGYLDKNNLPNMKPNQHKELLEDYNVSSIIIDDRTPPSFIKKYAAECFNEEQFPLWMLTEILEFGWIIKLLKAMGEKTITNFVAQTFGVNKLTLFSWLNCLRNVRNICAHHSRLFNRRNLYAIKIPNKDLWNKPVKIKDVIEIKTIGGKEGTTQNNQRTLFPILSVLAYMLKIIIPESQWKNRVKDLLKEFDSIDKTQMGFPEKWEESGIWK